MPVPHEQSRPPVDDDTARKQKEARLIWRESQEIQGTIAETYLREARRIGLDVLPECLQFHPGLLPDPRQSETCPAMIAAVTNSLGDLVAIQRTFSQVGWKVARPRFPHQSAALDQSAKGLFGWGQRVQSLELPRALKPGFPELSFSACRFGVLSVLISPASELANSVRQVVIFADKGKAGEDAAAKARQIFRSQGRKVAVRFSELGDDFNDELRARRNGA